MRFINTKGDTIIEVMICLVITSFILTTAYGSARRSQITIRTAQERQEALKLAETQVEFIKAKNLDQSGSFCFDATGNRHTNGGPPTDIDNLSGDTLNTPTNYHSNCKQSNLYFVSVKKNTTAVAPTVQYDISVRWFGLGGGRNQVVIGYRIK